MTSRAIHLRVHAFTLIEMMLSTAIIAIILLGVQSAIVLAAKAAPNRTTGNSATLSSAAAMDLFSADLSCATSIVSMSASAIEFTVPDRNGDNAAETIRYSWTGSSGAPLLRTVNNGSAATVASNINQFTLTYDRRSQTNATTSTESGEVLLGSNDGILTLYLADFETDNANWIGEYFSPTLPSGATQWRVTRVKFRAHKNGGKSGTSRVQLRTGSGVSLGNVLDEASLVTAPLSSSYSWQEFTFTNATARTPGSGLFLVIQSPTASDSCFVQYQSALALTTNWYMVKTYNSGASWTAPLVSSMIFYVYGTYSTPDPATYSYRLANVRCTLRSGSDVGQKLNTSIQLLNEPQVSAP